MLFDFRVEFLFEILVVRCIGVLGKTSNATGIITRDAYGDRFGFGLWSVHFWLLAHGCSGCGGHSGCTRDSTGANTNLQGCFQLIPLYTQTDTGYIGLHKSIHDYGLPPRVWCSFRLQQVKWNWRKQRTKKSRANQPTFPSLGKTSFSPHRLLASVSVHPTLVRG